jgi:hypothetical protein
MLTALEDFRWRTGIDVTRMLAVPALRHACLAFAGLALLSASCSQGESPVPRSPRHTGDPPPIEDPRERELRDFQERVVRVAAELDALGFSTEIDGLSIEYRNLDEGFDDTVAAYDRLLRSSYFEGAFALEKTLGITGARDPRDQRARMVGGSLLSLAAYYQPFRSAIVFLANPSVESVDRDEVVAHELAHAYHDQTAAGGLAEFLSAVDLSVDESLVRDCLSEGFAEILAAAVFASRLGVDLADVDLSIPPLWTVPPPGEEAVQLLRYRVGRDVLFRRYRKAGWDGVRELLANPPETTRKLIHAGEPAKDRPIRVELPVLPAPAELRHTDTIGELAIYGYLISAGATYDQAYRSAAGWAGDQLLAYRDAEGGWGIAWRTLWDAAEDAEQFARLLTELVPSLDGRLSVRGRVVDLARAESSAFERELMKKLKANRDPSVERRRDRRKRRRR